METKNTIANRQPTQAEIELSKGMGTVNEATRRLIEAGGFPIFQRTIDDPAYLDALIDFDRNYFPAVFSYPALLRWFQDNNLERFLDGGSLEKQIRWQSEEFYGHGKLRGFYLGKSFRRRIFVEADRLPAIKAGLESGCINWFLILSSSAELYAENLIEAEFFFFWLLRRFKEDGFQIWNESETELWTKMTLAELLARCNPTEPEEFDPVAFENDWVSEAKKILGKKKSPPKIKSGVVRGVFTSNLPDIPVDQKIINKKGELVKPKDHSYISAINSGVRVLSQGEGIVLAAQMFSKDKTYLAPGTWEWRRDIIDHRDKHTDPDVSVAHAGSGVDGLCLHSFLADDFSSAYRLRLAL